MNEPKPVTRTVTANNLSRASENKIHDDSVARRFGFTGGLVPGVEVYAYACHPVVNRWGEAWLERGGAECRFLKPVYDGRPATVTATANADGFDLRVDSDGVLCATGTAWLGAAQPAPALTDFPERPPVADRPPANETTVAAGTWLGSKPFVLTPAAVADYRAGIGETDPLYAARGLAHPGQVLRLCNYVLAQNVVLGPWIHVGSRVQNFAPARVGQTLVARALVRDNYERRGHRFVDLDVLIVADGDQPIAQVQHTAIYQLRAADPAA